MVYGAASACKGINLRGREAYATVPNTLMLVRGITKFLHYCFSKVILGEMEMKHYHDSENVETFPLVTGVKVFAAINLPSVLPAAGLSGARQMYLWDNCTAFC